MTAVERLTIRPLGSPGAHLAAAATHLGVRGVRSITESRVVFVRGELDVTARAALTDVLVDPLIETGTWDPDPGTPSHAIEVALHAGVTDADAAAVAHAAARLGIPVTDVATGRRYEVDGSLDAGQLELLSRRLLANPVIERWSIESPVRPAFAAETPIVPAELVHLPDDDAALAAINAERGLALDPEELRTIRAHFAAAGRDPTDVELETLAQTWSEHCAHKSFRAAITTPDGADHDRRPLLAQLRAATEAIDAPFVVSSFVGNAGIVRFAPGRTIALKCETHNHPSAVEPFGGANTGVGGVIRDVLGAAHRPIAVTDILCFGPDGVDADDLPDGVLHPSRIRDGVVAGVADYGNKIGLPTVAGAVLYDPGYTANPLVFCGCIGEAPDDQPPLTGPHPGDRVVVLGGRTGRDGLRGATFSSATMNATTGEVAGASVQIGDPITEKLLIDALDGAHGLISAITDCGAGGLSSAIGEMAEGVGATVDLDDLPLKYPGLSPWERWLSEAQERMVVAVPPAHLPELAAHCQRFDVELTDLGAFTGDGRLVVRQGGQVVLDLDTGFLHDGRPQRRLEAVLPAPERTVATDAGAARRAARHDPAGTLLALLAHPNVASKAPIIHRYDHEILGRTVARPLTPGDGPGDGVVLAEPSEAHGLAIGIGVNPWFGLHDPERMAWAVVDEAIRNVVAVGADPDRIALLDNFSWGDPRRPSTFGELVAAVQGCCDAAIAHRAPFVSGKDSLNNEYLGADGARHAVPPTLVVTAVAHVPDADRTVPAQLARAGDVLVLVGRTLTELRGSHLDLVLGVDGGGSVPAPDPNAPDRYRRLHGAIRQGLVRACHDCSEGGLAVAVAEMCIGASLGATLHDLGHADPVTALFSESTGRLVCEVAPDDLEAFTAAMGEPVLVLGQVVAEPTLTVAGVAPLDVATLDAAWKGTR
jgi:phosphoribosylformylglycinamidine synthase